VDWLFELDGEGLDKLALRPLASACNCTIRPGPDATPWLGGTKFDGMTTPEQALEDAKKTLVHLNGLARLVILTPSPDLFISAKDLLIEAMVGPMASI
jgi:hypothetical protein